MTTVRMQSPLRHWVTLGAILAAAMAVWPAAADAAPARKAALQHALDRVVAGGPGGGVLLVRDRGHALRLTSGEVDRRTRAPLHATDRFRVASLTKSFVATAVLRLVEDGRLGLDDTVERWLPGVVPGGDGITIRQLLDHTSGIFDNFENPELMAPYERGRFGHRYTPRELLALGTSHPPLFAPGTAAAYSNTGYVVLGLIVESVTGRSLGDELEREVFRPANLRATTFGTGRRRDGRRAHGYAPLGGPLRDMDRLNLSFEWAAGAIVSTAGDVARFYRALLAGRLVPPQLLRVMRTPALGAADGYGAGLEKLSSPCGPVWGHSGGTPGFTSHAYSSRDGRRQVVALYGHDPDAVAPAVRRADLQLLIAAYCGH